MTAALKKHGSQGKKVGIFGRILQALKKMLMGSTAAAPGSAPGQSPMDAMPVMEAAPEAEDGDNFAEENGYENSYLAKMVRDYNIAFENMDYNTRSDIREKLEKGSDKSRAVHFWVSRLSDHDRAIIMNCTREQIANHIGGIEPIENVAACGQGVPYATRPHTPKPSQDRKDEKKNDTAAVIEFPKPKRPEPVASQDFGTVDFEPELSHWEMQQAQASQRHDAYKARQMNGDSASIHGPSPSRRFH